MTTLLWTPEAIDDREQIYRYIETDKPLAALALDELFDEQAALLIAPQNRQAWARGGHTRAGRAQKLFAGV